VRRSPCSAPFVVPCAVRRAVRPFSLRRLSEG
jgi:hypothetical protein